VLSLLLYDSMTREKRVFRPQGDTVTLYVCGVTPYDTTHLGHARTYLVFDVLQRYWRHLGYGVRYVQNVTDVDDPLFARARDLGVDYRDLARKYVDIFVKDLQDLNVGLPDVYPRASEEIPGMIDTIRGLTEREMAYEHGGSVYFRAARFPGYGRMGRLDRAGMLDALAETGEDPRDPNKEDPLDFRLWHTAQPDEPVWESPWGPGRPGWHIECSTMASRYLGSRLDVHGGGADLVFPHHCSEIAQSESATGEAPFSQYWVHVGLVWMDGEKMSKSKGNMAFARDLIAQYGAEALRYYLLGFPYREQLEYFAGDMAAAARRWEAIAAASQGASEPGDTENSTRACEAVLGALDDDLDSPLALAALDELAAAVRNSGSPAHRAALQSLLELLGFNQGATRSAPETRR
jgi:L-cysteine:1D-myo-inositol 2-amino-2-deoxy-alpha-D-glucopyranoside ligase